MCISSVIVLCVCVCIYKKCAITEREIIDMLYTNFIQVADFYFAVASTGEPSNS